MANSGGNQLYGLVGSEVKINRGGPDSFEGNLLGIQSDYLALGSSNGIIYVNNTHVKSISANTGGSSENAYSGDGSYVMAANFNAVLKALRHEYVQINRGGPEKLAGVISDVTSDFVLIVVDNVIVRVPLFHIKSVNVITSNKSGGNNKSGNNNSKSGGNNKSGNNKSGNKNSSGSRSGGSNGSRGNSRGTGGRRTGGGRSNNKKRSSSKNR
ncbi:hypothetical protein [Paenibacillus cremeus]|uniref:hypothetical protein n=1 Tax=Paenibacillus cremeus TaxID=2163881 RepID=UPI0016492AF8|nr:hypothetical protein [Paenibacillus cremeus]